MWEVVKACENVTFNVLPPPPLARSCDSVKIFCVNTIYTEYQILPEINAFRVVSKKQVSECMSDWVYEWVEWVSVWMSECMNEWVRMRVRVSEWARERVSEWEWACESEWVDTKSPQQTPSLISLTNHEWPALLVAEWLWWIKESQVHYHTSIADDVTRHSYGSWESCVSIT